MKKSLLALSALAAMGDVASPRSRVSCDSKSGIDNGCYANVDSATLNDNKFMQAFGDADAPSGKLNVAANPTAADVLRIMRIPAGNRVSALIIANDGLDTNGSQTFVVSIGYAYCDAADGSAVVDYFSAAGDGVLKSANAGKVYANFDAITFEHDVYLTMTVGTHAATFAAGNVRAVALATARGAK